MYQIKTIPEDFIVEEIPDFTIDKSGSYTYFKLTKTGYTTLNALKKISFRTKIDFKKFSFAGTKDKNAVTTQFASVNSNIGRWINNFSGKDISVEFVGMGSEPISLGRLKGNHFKITVRNVSCIPKAEPEINFINYFGKQRFSVNNADIGKLLVKQDVKGAVELLLSTDRQYKNVLRAHLNNNKNDYVGAIKRIPKKIVLMYIHSYQSLIWNKTAELLASSGFKDDVLIPLVGFGTDLGTSKVGSIIKRILSDEGIAPRDFIIRNIPEISSEGDARKYITTARNIKITGVLDDEYNMGMKKFVISFDLDKGCYATEFIRHIMSFCND